MSKYALIIDDNKLVTESLKENIDWHKLDVVVTHVFYDALQIEEVVASETVDIIISDIRMPGLSGLEMAKEVLKQNPAIKIILISAYEDFQYVQEAIRLGAYDFIEKPIDLAYLSSIIAKAAAQIDLDLQTKRQLEASKPAMVEKFFYDVLHHAPAEAKYNYGDYPIFLSLTIESHFHLCIVIKNTNANQLKNALGLQRYHMDLLSLENDIGLQFADFPLAYLLHKGNSLVLVIGKGAASAVQLLMAAEERLSPILERASLFKLAVGIGNTVASFWDIRESYENAKLALEYRFFFPEETILRYQDLPPENSTPDLNLESKCKYIINLICKNDVPRLEQYLDSLYEEYLKLHISRDSLFFIISDMAGKVLNFLYKMGVDLASLDEDLMKYWGNLKRFSTGQEVFQWFFRLCAMAGSLLDTSVSGYQKRLASLVENYIQLNYANPDLGLNEIAASVNVSPTHLSAAFKETTGSNIVDLIGSTRIMAAKELLMNTELSIREISEKTGFSNQYYFSACFKKITGMAPTGFRNPNH